MAIELSSSHYKYKMLASRVGCSPNTPQDFTSVQDSQELVLGGGLVEVGSLLVDKERVRNPDEVDVFSTHDKFLKAWSALERQAGICPELSEVHVHREVLWLRID